MREYRSATPMHKRLSTRMAELYGLYAYKNAEIRCAAGGRASGLGVY